MGDTGSIGIIARGKDHAKNLREIAAVNKMIVSIEVEENDQDPAPIKNGMIGTSEVTTDKAIVIQGTETEGITIKATRKDRQKKCNKN